VELGMLIRQTFESVVMTALYPRSQIDIYVQVLQSDGGSFMSLRPHEFIALWVLDATLT
jgi:ribonuclease PH